jgi:hypothetical protein
MFHRIVLAATLALCVSLAASQPISRAKPLEIERIAIVGHGVAFDSKMRPIQLDLKTIRSMQNSLRDGLANTRAANRPGMRYISERIESAKIKAGSEEEKSLLTGVLIRRQLEGADKQTLAAYDWRNTFLVERARALLSRRYKGRYKLAPETLILLREGLNLKAFETDYMAECRSQKVPVPPNFSMAKPGAWVKQGSLTYKLLLAESPAQVWTWFDRKRPGACVALPRDNGEPGSVAGIICQSAITGRACFWDNLTRADPTRRIPAATETMVINKLQDGRTLDVEAPCTTCHAGNNVFLMSPDDPTWAKLMRGPLPKLTQFSTIYKPLADTTAASHRYTPIAHASWVNPPLTTGCAGSCHASPSTKVEKLWSNLPTAKRPPMPPACATSDDFRNCYYNKP